MRFATQWYFRNASSSRASGSAAKASSVEARLVEFAEILRQNGLRVSPAEVADAARAVNAVGLDDRGSFHAAVAAALCKRGGDVELFDRLFEIYFSGAAAMLEGIDRSLVGQLEAEGFLSGDQLEEVVSTVNRLFNQLDPLTQAMLLGDRAALARILRAAVLQLDFARLQTPMQQGFYSRRLLAAAGAGRTSDDIAAIEAELARRGLSPSGLELVSRALAEALRHVEEAARRQVQREVRARIRRSTGGTLADRAFSSLTREEVEKTERAVRKLAERLKSRLVRRQRSRRRGSLHVRRTLRQNLTWGGVPARLAFRNRRPQRPDVIILCDVSDSVRNVSRMMLLFVHTLQSLFNRVRSFVFVSDIGEITAQLRDADVRQAIDLAIASKAINVHSNSNYGRALATFVKDSLGSVTRKTTVLVIGDGRNNYNPANVWALKDLRRKAKRLIWICPEDRRAWGIGDSEMHHYAKACDRVATVQNLADLQQVAETLVPV
jgi:uncharacterized protein